MTELTKTFAILVTDLGKDSLYEAISGAVWLFCKGTWPNKALATGAKTVMVKQIQKAISKRQTATGVHKYISPAAYDCAQDSTACSIHFGPDLIIPYEEDNAEIWYQYVLENSIVEPGHVEVFALQHLLGISIHVHTITSADEDARTWQHQEHIVSRTNDRSPIPHAKPIHLLRVPTSDTNGQSPPCKYQWELMVPQVRPQFHHIFLASVIVTAEMLSFLRAE